MKNLLKVLGWALAVVAITPVVFFVWVMWEAERGMPEAPPAPEMTQAEKDAGELRYACRSSIESILHDPSSAEWGMRDDGWFQRWPVEDEGDRLSVTATFRAKNSFGALVVGSYRCNAEREGDKLFLTSVQGL